MLRTIISDPYMSVADLRLDDEEEAHRLPVTSSRPRATFHFDPLPNTEVEDSKRYLADAWQILKPAINIIFGDAYKRGVIDCSTIFRAVQCACLVDSGHVQLLYDLIKQECEPHISLAIQSLEKQMTGDLSVFLPLVEQSWLDFRKKMMFVFDLAMFMPCNGTTLWDLGLGVFQKQLSLAPQVQYQVIAGILELINKERLLKTGEHMSLLSNLMDMFKGQWDVFTKPFLDSTSKFYAAEAEKLLGQLGISEYLKYVEWSFREERKMCMEHGYYFYTACWFGLVKVVEMELLVGRGSLLEKGFTVLMDVESIDDLRRINYLFNRAHTRAYMDQLLRSYIREKVTREGSLQELHTRIGRIWCRCFGENAFLGKSIIESFKDLGLHVPDELLDLEKWEEEDDGEEEEDEDEEHE